MRGLEIRHCTCQHSCCPSGARLSPHVPQSACACVSHCIYSMHVHCIDCIFESVCTPLCTLTHLFWNPMTQNVGDQIHDLKRLLFRAIIISASPSKLLIGPHPSIRGFHTHLMKWRFTHGETWSWNQRHGSIIHSYYKNTASKDTYQITISAGYAFSSSQILQTHIHQQRERVHRENTHKQEVWKHLIFTSSHLISLMSSEKGYLFDWLITLMNIVVQNCRRRIESGSLVCEADPLTEEERKRNWKREKDDAAMLKHPWNQINEPCRSEDTVTHQQMQNRGRKEGVLLTVMEIWIYSKKQPKPPPPQQQQNERKDMNGAWAVRRRTLAFAAMLRFLEENKRGWEKWASRCDSLFLRPPWHHLLTAGMCSIIFINIGSSHSWQI